MEQSYRTGTVLNKVMQWLVLGYQTIAVLVFLASLFLANDWLKNPFIGGFFEQTLVLNGVDTTEGGKHWALYEQGFGLRDQLLSVDDRQISNANDLRNVLVAHKTGDIVPVTILPFGGTEKTVQVTLQSFPRGDLISYFILPASLSLVFLIISLWIFGLRRTEPAGRAFSVMTSSLAIVIGSLFDLYTSHRFTYLWTMAAALSAGAIIDLALGFPQEARVVIGRPYLRWIGYLIGIGLGACGVVLAWQALTGGWRNLPVDDDHAMPDWVAFATISAGIVLQMAIIGIAGFVIASAILFVLIARGYGSRRLLRDTLIALVLSTAVYLLFTKALGLSLPAGLIVF